MIDVAAINPAAILLYILVVVIGVLSRPSLRWAIAVVTGSVGCGLAYWLSSYVQGSWPSECILLDAPGDCRLAFVER